MTTRKTATKSTAPARVAFVGSGPGDPALLTVRAVALLKDAKVVITDQVADASFVSELTQDSVELVDGGHGDAGQKLTAASRAKLVVRTAKAAGEGALVVRLMDGDPATFNGLAEEAAACAKSDIAFEIVPGVSAVSAVPSYAGVPLTASDTKAVHVIPARVATQNWEHLSDNHSTLVVLGSGEDIVSALGKLAASGREPSTAVSLTGHGTTIRQQTVTLTLGELDGLRADVVKSTTVAVVGSTVEAQAQLSWWETKPLYGWNILVPRTKDQAGGMITRLAEHGASCDVVPTISVEPPRTPQQMERAVKGLVTGRYEWIGFTSANAVRAVREKFVEYGLDVRAFAGLKIAAVGGVTAEALRTWGLEPDLVPSGEQSARGLLEDWPDYDELLDPINRVFLPRADIATDTLVAGLQDIGWEVDDVTAYRTVRAAPPAPEVREAIKTGKFDAVCFTSSSTVRNLVGIAGKPHASTVVACIGPATAKTAEEHGLKVDVLASEASADALVEALADFGRGLVAAAAEAGEPVRRPSEKKKAGARRKAKA
ncbi:uroporphyrinogen-III synthase [Dermacoccaceae bacterium W4C1]